MKLKELLHVLKNVDPEAWIEICPADRSEKLAITGIEVSLPASEAVRLAASQARAQRIPSDWLIQPDGYPLVLIHVEGEDAA